ncbi:hypothetical protein Vi05172_g3670 [Venturia inaequalis]|nr:hypothetical protein Vi05172_g3670 [Venturia inaequalis]
MDNMQFQTLTRIGHYFRKPKGIFTKTGDIRHEEQIIGKVRTFLIPTRALIRVLNVLKNRSQAFGSLDQNVWLAFGYAQSLAAAILNSHDEKGYGPGLSAWSKWVKQEYPNAPRIWSKGLGSQLENLIFAKTNGAEVLFESDHPDRPYPESFQPLITNTLLQERSLLKDELTSAFSQGGHTGYAKYPGPQECSGMPQNISVLHLNVIPPSSKSCDLCASKWLCSIDLYHKIPDITWFRLLYLKPRRRTDPLECQLRCARRCEAEGMYEALSYSWHSWQSQNIKAALPCNITCNGIRFEAQPNLVLALRNLRSQHQERIMWVDAICINHGAARTLIWLGELDYETTQSALDNICYLVNEWDENMPACYWTKRGESPQEEEFVHPTTRPKTPSAEDSLLLCLRPIFDSAWFQRKLVIQEVVLARDAEVSWCHHKISWRWIGLAAAILRNQHHSLLDELYNRQGFYNAYLMFRLSTREGFPTLQLSFLHLLRLTANFKTTDPRDAVYAILGIATKDNIPRERPFIAVDVSCGLEALLYSVAERFLETSHPLNFLSNAQGVPKRGEVLFKTNKSVSMKPTWIPDWQESSCSAILGPWSLNEPWNPSRGLDFQRNSSTNCSELVVRGILVSMVLFCGSPNRLGVQSLVRNGAFGLLTHNTFKVLACTMVGGRNEYGGRENHHNALDDDLFAFIVERCEDEGSKTSWVPHNKPFVPDVKRYFTPAAWSAYWGPDSNLKRSRAEFKEGAARFERLAAKACNNRWLFLTTGGHLGLGPWSMLPGDEVCILGGADMPFVLRREEDYFRLVGECYIGNMMDGEAVQAVTHSTMHRGFFEPGLMLERAFRCEGAPKAVRKMIVQLKRDVLGAAGERYSVLKECWISIR